MLSVLAVVTSFGQCADEPSGRRGQVALHVDPHGRSVSNRVDTQARPRVQPLFDQPRTCRLGHTAASACEAVRPPSRADRQME